MGLRIRDDSPFGNIEKYLAGTVYPKGLELLLRRYGVDTDVHRQITRGKPSDSDIKPEDVEDITRNVYGILNDLSPSGHNADATPNQIFTCRMLIAAAIYSDDDDTFASDFEQKYIVTEALLLPGDSFYIKRKDGVVKGWHITANEGVGATQKVFKRYNVSSLSE